MVSTLALNVTTERMSGRNACICIERRQMRIAERAHYTLTQVTARYSRGYPIGSVYYSTRDICAGYLL
jgi:hypothetical protein